MSDVERRFVSHLTTPEAIAEAWELGIRPEIFLDPLCAAVYGFSVEYWFDSHMQMAPTALVLEHEFPGFTTEPTEETLAWLAGDMQRRYATNQLQNMVRQAASTSVEEPVDTLRQLYADAYDASESIAPRTTRSDMSVNVDERRQRYGEREQFPDGIGLTLGIDALDIHTGGLMPGELAVVGAFSKTGKSFFLCNAAVALHQAGHTPMLFTLEMSRREMEDRIDALYSGVSYNRLVHAKLKKDEQEALALAQEQLAKAGSLLVESPDEGDRTVSYLVNRARQAGADYILIDQLSFMEATGRWRTTKEHHANIMKGLKNEIRRSGREVPCLMAVQLNRDSLDEGAQLKNFADASEVERFCDLALGLERNNEERMSHVMRCHILGSRRSEKKSWQLHWELTTSSRISVLQEVQ